MKTLIKRHLIGLFALVLTVATMSFKMVEKSTNNSNNDLWYYTLSTDDGYDEEENFEPAGVHTECTGGSDIWCVIRAPQQPGTNLPDLDNIQEFVSYKP